MYRKFYLVLLENVKLLHLKKKVNCPSDIQDSVWNVVFFFFGGGGFAKTKYDSKLQWLFGHWIIRH